jgi:predicted GH43/DUF377 family glycosyl hydrolase
LYFIQHLSFIIQNISTMRLLPVCLVFFFSCSQAPQKVSETTGQVESLNAWALLPFTKVDSINPILTPGTNVFNDPIWKKSVAWEAKNVFNPAMIVRNDTVFMLYRAQDSIGKPDGTSRVGMAVSTDGLHFTRKPAPVLYPDNDSYKNLEWEGGCEDPRITQREDGLYIMTYTSFDSKVARLMVASSPDLYHWTKHGSAFAKALDGKYYNKWSKSGSVVSVYDTTKATITAAKINGKYWMYWGDQFIWAATSTDCINWQPVEMGDGEIASVPLRGIADSMPLLKVVIPTRPKKFDSDLVEPGPAAMLTNDGILLIYNSRNIPSIGDSSLEEGTYAAGQALMSKTDPTKLINRLDNYFMKPDKPYEITGQVNQVCFIEGLVHYKGKWLLYYGTADSRIAVATK